MLSWPWKWSKTFNVPQVLIDNEAAAVAAVEHLIGLGHTRIAHIAGPIPEGMSVRRQKGYCVAMQAAGLDIPPSYMCRGDFSLQSGERCARALLSAERRAQPPSLQPMTKWHLA